MTIRFHKVVGAMPAELEPDAVYAVRTGEGFDLHVTDSTGAVAHSVDSGLPAWATPIQPAADPIPAGWHELATFTAGPVEMRLLTQTAPVVVHERAAWTATTRSIHSGHSLTDAYTYHEWPGYLVTLRNSLLDPDDGDGSTYVVRSTIPGSPMSWRWLHSDEANIADAVAGIGAFDALMITEAGAGYLQPRGQFNSTNGGVVESLTAFRNFILNTIDNGAGSEVVLWSIWPALRGPGTDNENPTPTGAWAGYTFRTGLDEFGRVFRAYADWGTWAAHQDRPSLPEDWRVWLIPGHLWMARVYDDIAASAVPGITAIDDLFQDDIHPNAAGGYGLACLAYTCLYQVDLRGQTGVFVPAGVTTAQRDYFWALAWDIATTFEPVGMGGTQGAAASWTPADGDPLAGDAPEEPGDDLPDFDVMEWTAEGYTGPVLTGTQPTVVAGELVFAETATLTGAVDAPDRSYGIARLRPTALPESSLNVPAVVLGAGGGDWWSVPHFRLSWNGYLNDGTYIALAGEDGVGGNSESATVGAMTTVEWWRDGQTMHICVNGIHEYTATATEAIGATSRITLFPDASLGFTIAAIGIASDIPDAAGRAAARAWAEA